MDIATAIAAVTIVMIGMIGVTAAIGITIAATDAIVVTGFISNAIDPIVS